MAYTDKENGIHKTLTYIDIGLAILLLFHAKNIEGAFLKGLSIYAPSYLWGIGFTLVAIFRYYGSRIKPLSFFAIILGIFLNIGASCATIYITVNDVAVILFPAMTIMDFILLKDYRIYNPTESA